MTSPVRVFPSGSFLTHPDCVFNFPLHFFENQAHSNARELTHECRLFKLNTLVWKLIHYSWFQSLKYYILHLYTWSFDNHWPFIRAVNSLCPYWQWFPKCQNVYGIKYIVILSMNCGHLEGMKLLHAYQTDRKYTLKWNVSKSLLGPKGGLLTPGCWKWQLCSQKYCIKRPICFTLAEIPKETYFLGIFMKL